MNKVRWSESEDAILREGYAAKLTPEEIAARLGRSVWSIVAKATKSGVSSRRGTYSRPQKPVRPPRPPKLPASEKAPKAPVWSPEEDAKLRAGYAAGLSTTQIAIHVGRAGSACAARAYRLGISERRNGRPVRIARLPSPKIEVREVRPQPERQQLPVCPSPTPTPSVPVEPAPEPLRIPFLEVKYGMCRWPLWSSHGYVPIDEKMVCGLPVIDGKSYCPHHLKVSTQERIVQPKLGAETRAKMRVAAIKRGATSFRPGGTAMRSTKG